MDTNSKNKFKYFFHPILLSIILSIFFVSIYPISRDKLITKEVGANYYFTDSLFGQTLGFMSEYLIQTRFEKEPIPNDFRFEEVDNLKYFIHDRATNKAITNIEGMSLTQFKSLMEDALYATHIQFNGDSYTLNGSFKNEPFTSTYVSFYISNHLNYPTFDAYYFVPSTLSHTEDFITRNISDFRIIPSTLLLLASCCIGIIITILSNLFIPYTIQDTYSLCRKFNKSFLEVKVLLLVTAAFLLFAFSSGIADESSSIFYIKKLITESSYPYYTVGILFTFIACLLISLITIYIKSIYYKGFKENFLKRIGLIYVVYKIYYYIKKWCLSLFTLSTINSIHYKLLLLLTVHTLILIMIGFVWYDRHSALGITLSVIYSVFLLYIISKHFNQIKKLYTFSNHLASGNFEKHPKENMGFLQPIADQLHIINDSFKAAVDQEVKSQNMKTELISSVSHDLKTPLTSIITSIDFLKDKDLSPEQQQEYLDILDRKSKRLKILIEDLFEASKAASGNIELHQEPIDLVALLQQTLGELKEKIDNNDLYLRTHLPEQKVICNLDGRRTYRILENLISNITKYAASHSRVYIDVTTKDSLATVTFRNISAYEMNFDPSEITARFKRGDLSRHTEGSGLGLAIAKDLTELQQGTLTIYIDGDLFKVILSFPIVSAK